MFIDTNVLIYLENPVSEHYASTIDAIVRCASETDLKINGIVFAELAVAYPSRAELEAHLARFFVTRVDTPPDALFRAAKAFGVYRERGGPRAKILPDFFIGADAELAGAPLLTNDPDLYRTYFPDLDLITP